MSELVLVNPRRKKRKATRRKTARRNPARRTKRRVTRRTSVARRRTSRRRVRRNPKLSIKSVTRDALIPASVGALGALALDITLGFIPLPANLKSGPIGSITKIVAAIVLGKVAGKVLGTKRGEQVTAGAITVLAYDAAKKMLAANMPGIPLSGSDFAYNPTPGMGEFIGSGADLGGLGYMNAGASAPLSEYIASDGMTEMDYQ